MSFTNDWVNNIEKSTVKRNEINLLVMDYLISEGFKEAAERFKTEANIETDKDDQTKTYSETDEQIDKRISVRNAIESGEIQRSIQLINQYYPLLIDDNHGLYFELEVSCVIALLYSVLINCFPSTATAFDRIDTEQEHT